MAKNWDYAELSKAAKALGGPENYVKIIETNSRIKGRKDMGPWLLLATILGICVTKGVEFCKSKLKESEKELETAKVELIQGIRDYDSQHEEDNNNNIAEEE